MTRALSKTPLLVIAVLAVSLIALQCPVPTCTGCTGDEVVVKQAGVVSFATAFVAITSAVQIADAGRLSLAVSATPDVSSDLAFMCSRLII